MSPCQRAVVLLSLVGYGSLLHGQAAKTPAPATKAGVGAFDVGIVKRAEALMPSPAQWNRTDTGRCPRADTTYTVRCALERAVKEAAGLPWKGGPPSASTATVPPKLDCSMDVSAEHPGGSCGTLWDELPVFILSRAQASASGVWRKDAKPSEVWIGTMADAEWPVDYESRHGVDLVSGRKASDQLISFNNDSTTTFENVQAYFRALEAQVLKAGAEDLSRNAEDVEIEIYAGGGGVMRAYNGWFPVSGFSRRGSAVRFKIDTVQQVAPNALDREILVRAAKIISSDAVWNRADNRQCPAAATTWSIYCAVEQAQVEVAGGFHHRRPAGELVRVLVDERTKSRNYKHRMMDYNNDTTTTLADVQSLFAEAIARIK